MDLKQVTKGLHEALDIAIDVAMKQGRLEAEASIAARIKGLLGTNGATTPNAASTTEESSTSGKKPKRKFRKTAAWRAAVKRNLAKGRGPRKSALKMKGKFKRKGRK